MSLKKGLLIRKFGAAFFASATVLQFSACAIGDDDLCVDCIYLNGDTVQFDAYYIASSFDTTFYSVELISSPSRFLAQRKLNYIVTGYNERNRSTKKLISESTTGFFEDTTRIWLHPPRVDKFERITQLAPYPEVNLPLRIGDTIRGKITMAFNWGEWNGHSSRYYLAVVDSMARANSNETVYVLNGCGKILNDSSCVEYLFSTTRGFIKASYAYGGKEFFYMEMRP